MKSPVSVTRRLCSIRVWHISLFGGFLTGSFFGFANGSSAQTVQPQPTAASTPVATPTAAPYPNPTPTDTPYPGPTSTPVFTPTDSPTPIPTTAPTGGGTPSLTVVPGVPSVGETDAYNLARTPQVSITLTASNTPSGGTSSTNMSSSRPVSTLQPAVRGGLCALTTLQPAASSSRSKTSHTSITNTSSASQPVATITLMYSGGAAGQHVWVQALRGGGTLSATDGAGHSYDGSRGFWLTLDASGTATFNYQAPNASGTYPILTRYTNVKTTLPFVVPDPVP